MPANLPRLLELWNLEQMPACDEGMELAEHFIARALEAVNIHDEAEAIPKRNAIIRAHKVFTEHRGTCGKCNEIDIIP
jgi:hypothetical protein